MGAQTGTGKKDEAKVFVMNYFILDKAFGKKDISHLVKKVITDKRGRRTTVWVLPDGAETKQLSRSELMATGVNWHYRQILRKEGHMSLLGQKIDDPSDLVSLAQIYRNPLYETFRIVMLDNNNIIKGLTGISIKLPGVSDAFTGHDRNKAMRELEAKMDRIGASKYYLVHNHPSGNPAPSGQHGDLSVTRDYLNGYIEPGTGQQVAGVKGFLGHIIVDHNTWAMIDEKTAKNPPNEFWGEKYVKRLKKQVEGEDPLKRPEKAHAALGLRLRAPTDLVNLVKEFHLKQDGYLVLIGRTADGKVSGIMEMPHHYLDGAAEKGQKEIVRFARMCGAGTVFGAEIQDKHIGTVMRLMQDGYLRDAVSASGLSLVEQGAKATGETILPPGMGTYIREEQL